MSTAGAVQDTLITVSVTVLRGFSDVSSWPESRSVFPIPIPIKDILQIFSAGRFQAAGHVGRSLQEQQVSPIVYLMFFRMKYQRIVRHVEDDLIEVIPRQELSTRPAGPERDTRRAQLTGGAMP